MAGWRRGCTLVALLGCANPQPGEHPDETRAGLAHSDLVTSLEVETGADTVRFVLHVTNAGTQPVVLEFNSAARYDFEVRTPAGAEIWRWSAGHMFAQVLGTDTVAAGETRRYSAGWAAGNRPGPLVAIGRVLATNYRIEQRADFEIRQQ